MEEQHKPKIGLLPKINGWLRQQLQSSLEWANNYWYILLAAIILLALAGWGAYLHWGKGYVLAEWTGLTPYIDADGKLQRGKTLWDWLELLVIPIVLALGAFWLQRSERDNERKIADQRRQDDLDRAKDQQRETALQAYIDKLTELLLDEKHPLRESSEEDEVRAVARTRTLATLRGLDPARKGMLLGFLYEADLLTPVISKGNDRVQSAIINLDRADLSGAHLYGANLTGAILTNTDLSKAYLTEANLSGVNLSRARLVGAHLSGANLSGADLSGANLTGADLSGAILTRAILKVTNLTIADLSGANLVEADLSGAFLGVILKISDIKITQKEADSLPGLGINPNGAYLGPNLTGADLTGALVTNDQLASAKSLENATMPDGKKYDPAIHRF